MRAHISLNVTDIESTVAFYSKVFGQKPQKQTSDYAKFDLANPPLNFSMLKSNDTRKLSKVNHFGIEVASEEELKTWQDKLTQNGVAVLPEENTNCCFARQDKVWFRDPDGNAWEVFFVHEQLPVVAAEPPKMKQASACSSVSGCC